MILETYILRFQPPSNNPSDTLSYPFVFPLHLSLADLGYKQFINMSFILKVNRRVVCFIPRSTPQ